MKVFMLLLGILILSKASTTSCLPAISHPSNFFGRIAPTFIRVWDDANSNTPISTVSMQDEKSNFSKIMKFLRKFCVATRTFTNTFKCVEGILVCKDWPPNPYFPKYFSGQWTLINSDYSTINQEVLNIFLEKHMDEKLNFFSNISPTELNIFEGSKMRFVVSPIDDEESFDAVILLFKQLCWAKVTYKKDAFEDDDHLFAGNFECTNWPKNPVFPPMFSGEFVYVKTNWQTLHKVVLNIYLQEYARAKVKSVLPRVRQSHKIETSEKFQRGPERYPSRFSKAKRYNFEESIFAQDRIKPTPRPLANARLSPINKSPQQSPQNVCFKISQFYKKFD